MTVFYQTGTTKYDAPENRTPARDARTSGGTVVKLIPVSSWAAETFGDHCPHRNTLLNWIRNGKITPTPKKIGRSYFCEPTACYQDPIADKIERMIRRGS
jgi:hypothetical protein